MLNVLILVTALGLPQGGDGSAAPRSLAAHDSPPAGAIVLARGGRDRVDPFAEIKERRRQEAKEKREKQRGAPEQPSQGQSN